MAFAVPGSILDGMSPHVWHGPTATLDWYGDVLAEGEHAGASGYAVALGEPRHVDVTGDTVCGRSRIHDVQRARHAGHAIRCGTNTNRGASQAPRGVADRGLGLGERRPGLNPTGDAGTFRARRRGGTAPRDDAGIASEPGPPDVPVSHRLLHPARRSPRGMEEGVEAAGLPERRMYDVRHTHITYMLGGMPRKTAQGRSGRSRPDITHGIYTHVQEGKERKAVGEVQGNRGYLSRNAS